MIWYSSKLDEVLKEQNTDAMNGLSGAEAQKRLEAFGPNQLTAKKKKTVVQRFLEQMTDFMVIILIVVAAISGVITVIEDTGEWYEPVIILLIVILNAVLGVVQESKAEGALEALKSMAAPQAKVMRDGTAAVINSSELVPGDVILLEAGDYVPADARLIESASLKSEESALTGESFPVEKSTCDDIENIAPLGDRINMIYSGCSVSYGRGKAVVVETGMNTEMGRIAKLLNDEHDGMTPLQQNLAKLGKTLGILALVICLVIFAVGVISNGFEFDNIIEMFMTAISLAVAAIPEGMPAIVTIVLAMGVRRMVKKNAIIRRLPAVETLGSASVICTDKTGTLTQNRMTLTRAWAVGGEINKIGEDISDDVKKLLLYATLCCDGRVETVDGVEKMIGDPTETAIVAALLHYGLDKKELDTTLPRVAEIPFDSDRKLMTSVNVMKNQMTVIVKGAPDVLLSRCEGADTKKADEINELMAKDALRVLAIGYKIIDDVPANPTSEELENGLTFLGLVGMIDPPRKEAMDAIKECDSAGIRTVMITGDHVITAMAIAKELGILREGDKALTGTELAAMSDEELDARIREFSVYARVSPDDKIRIVKAWQDAGEIVSMTGDGVNDAPALKAADIGCAMGITGTDVAKGAADMTLTDDNFATIVSAVREGRGLYDNIRKAVQFLLSCNLGEVITVFFAMILWKGTPLVAMQLLWINLVTDGLPALALGVEKPEYDIMSRKPRRKEAGIFSDGMGIATILQGIMIGGLTLFAFAIGWFVLGETIYHDTYIGGVLNESGLAHELGQTMAFGVLAMSQLFHAFNLRSSHSIFKVGIHTNKHMVMAFFASLALLLGVLLIPPVRGVFSLIALPGKGWLIIFACALVPVVVVEIYKLVRHIVVKSKA